MSAADVAVVRRFYEQMCNERKNELAPELFAADHVMHDPQVPAHTTLIAAPFLLVVFVVTAAVFSALSTAAGVAVGCDER